MSDVEVLLKNWIIRNETQKWIDKFKQELEILENGPITPFTQLQKEAVTSQLADLVKQLRDLRNA